ncbi:HNH endonuclease [Paenibacillus amylolyticus]|uniref:HNH endonuclease n=1 Tax=Paenibacillus amylolyticus TaxID=1451 RepID=UPI0015C2C453|nr:EVE domain-containing protein [Paenibacillus amylolyticus]
MDEDEFKQYCKECRFVPERLSAYKCIDRSSNIISPRWVLEYLRDRRIDLHINILQVSKETPCRTYTNSIAAKEIFQRIGIEILESNHVKTEVNNNLWIFQGNPNKFNINGYLSDRKYILWSIRQTHLLKKIKVGDEVFLWRAEAGKTGSGGVIGRAIITGLPELRKDDTNDMWFTDEGLQEFFRVPMEVQETRIMEGFIQRSLLVKHEILKDMRILKVANETNYLLNEQHAELLRGTWLHKRMLPPFPVLKPENRDREYKQYPESIRDKIIYKYLFGGKSHRWLDKNILGLSEDYSKGWFSMGVLHHIGLVNRHKGFFRGLSVANAIDHLSQHERDLNLNEYTRVIVSLIRFSENIYAEDVEAGSADRDGEEFSEGRLLYRLHSVRERNPRLVKQAKELFLKKHHRLFCEACGFDFKAFYGELGERYIEAHHKKMLSAMEPGETTKVEDLAMLCSNCHRMIHKKENMTVEELSELIKAQVH